MPEDIVTARRQVQRLRRHAEQAGPEHTRAVSESLQQVSSEGCAVPPSPGPVALRESAPQAVRATGADAQRNQSPSLSPESHCDLQLGGPHPRQEKYCSFANSIAAVLAALARPSAAPRSDGKVLNARALAPTSRSSSSASVSKPRPAAPQPALARRPGPATRRAGRRTKLASRRRSRRCATHRRPASGCCFLGAVSRNLVRNTSTLPMSMFTPSTSNCFSTSGSASARESAQFIHSSKLARPLPRELPPPRRRRHMRPHPR